MNDNPHGAFRISIIIPRLVLCTNIGMENFSYCTPTPLSQNGIELKTLKENIQKLMLYKGQECNHYNSVYFHEQFWYASAFCAIRCSLCSVPLMHMRRNLLHRTKHVNKTPLSVFQQRGNILSNELCCLVVKSTRKFHLNQVKKQTMFASSFKQCFKN